MLADIRLPDGSGEDLYRRVIPYLARTTIVFATAYADLAQAVRLVAAGANDYLTKPYDADKLIARIRAAIDLFDDVDSAAGKPENPLLISPATERAATQIQRLAGQDLTVLLQGETGAGKELAARYIHAHSPFSTGPFVAVNCASLSEDLAESQLFGHKRGAFSGARDAHHGLIDQANGGTLFLDEIGELKPQVQALLLRVLEDRRFQPLGANEASKANCRFVASTNIDLSGAVEDQKFRADLYYRLAIGHVTLPALRDRWDDILPLAHRFLHDWQLNTPTGDGKTLSAAAQAALQTHSWPGNVRELKNRVLRAVVIADGNIIEEHDLFPEGGLGGSEPGSLPSVRAQAELRSIQQAITVSGGQLGLAAKRLGISRTTLWKKLRNR